MVIVLLSAMTARFVPSLVLSFVFSISTLCSADAPPEMPKGLDGVTAGASLPIDGATGSRGRSSKIVEGLEIIPVGGMKLKVTAGKIEVQDRLVNVPESIIEIDSASVFQVRDEKLVLSDEIPMSFDKGTPLKHCLAFTASLPCLDRGSVVVKSAPGDSASSYLKNRDWRVDEMWGRVGRMPSGQIKEGQAIYADYRVRLQRLDTIFVNSMGEVKVNKGASQRVCPSAVGADYGGVEIANVFLDYNTRRLTSKDIYPIGGPAAGPDADVLAVSRERVSKTREKLEKGEDVTVVAWGDSITEGGDASRKEARFAEAFAQALRMKYPQARVRLVNAGRGGWDTTRSLPLLEKDVLQHNPDLVTMEFVNDMGLDEATLRANWKSAIGAVNGIGAESIVITPSFVMPSWMNFRGDRTPETRINVERLRQLASANGAALADVSRRWENLAGEGIPYVTHLRNGINHPDDFGHNLFVEELMRLF